MVDKLTERSLFAAVCVFLIVISIITVSRRSFPANTLLFHTSTERARPLEHVTVWSQPSIASKRAIPFTAETLYVMYGEGNFGDDNEHLLNYIRSMMSQQGPGGRHLCQESKVQYNPMGGAGVLDGLLNKRRNGFFVECGAFGGEDLSDSLFFEKERNWTGILIEAHPDYHHQILSKNRRAFVLPACLSHSRTPVKTKFKLAGWGSGVSSLNRNINPTDKSVPETDVQCFSLNSIMAAIGVRHIDLMILDVEGSELQVLETIDWKRITIDLFSIEYMDKNRVEKLNKIRAFFNKTGLNYKEVGKMPLKSTDATGCDVFFMRV